MQVAPSILMVRLSRSQDLQIIAVPVELWIVRDSRILIAMKATFRALMTERQLGFNDKNLIILAQIGLFRLSSNR